MLLASSTIDQNRLKTDKTDQTSGLTYHEGLMLYDSFKRRRIQFGTNLLPDFETALFYKLLTKDIFEIESRDIQKKIINDTQMHNTEMTSFKFNGGYDNIKGEIKSYQVFNIDSMTTDSFLKIFTFLRENKLLRKSFSKELQSFLRVVSPHIKKIIIVSGTITLDNRIKTWVSIAGFYDDMYSFYFTNIPVKSKYHYHLVSRNYFNINYKTDDVPVSRTIKIKEIQKILQEKISDERKEKLLLDLFRIENLFIRNLRLNEKNNIFRYALRIENLKMLREVI
jgi:hypothetical protein